MRASPNSVSAPSLRSTGTGSVRAASTSGGSSSASAGIATPGLISTLRPPAWICPGWYACACWAYATSMSSYTPLMRFRSISLCCSSMSSRTTWARFSAPTMSAYEVFFDARMFPPTKRCVMMWGFSSPESSVWMWYIFPLCLMLWLNPTTIFFASTPIGLRIYRSRGSAASAATRGECPAAEALRLHIHVLGARHRAAEEAPCHGEELLGRVRDEETVLRVARRAAPEALPHLRRDRRRAVDERHARERLRDRRGEERVVRAAEDERIDGRLAHRREVAADDPLDDLVARVGPALLGEGDEERAGARGDEGVRALAPDRRLVRAARDRPLRADDADPPRARGAHRDARAGLDDAEDRHRELGAERGERDGGGGVARDHEDVDAVAREEARVAERVLRDGLRRLRAVGHAGGVAEVERVGGRERVEDGALHGEAADAGVEDADAGHGAGVYPERARAARRAVRRRGELLPARRPAVLSRQGGRRRSRSPRWPASPASGRCRGRRTPGRCSRRRARRSTRRAPPSTRACSGRRGAARSRPPGTCTGADRSPRRRSPGGGGRSRRRGARTTGTTGSRRTRSPGASS